jgi:hypothetical protein
MSNVKTPAKPGYLMPGREPNETGAPPAHVHRESGKPQVKTK